MLIMSGTPSTTECDLFPLIKRAVTPLQAAPAARAHAAGLTNQQAMPVDVTPGKPGIVEPTLKSPPWFQATVGSPDSVTTVSAR
jgi:hypothetical protein